MLPTDPSCWKKKTVSDPAKCGAHHKKKKIQSKSTRKLLEKFHFVLSVEKENGIWGTTSFHALHTQNILCFGCYVFSFFFLFFFVVQHWGCFRAALLRGMSVLTMCARCMPNAFRLFFHQPFRVTFPHNLHVSALPHSRWHVRAHAYEP